MGDTVVRKMGVPFGVAGLFINDEAGKTDAAACPCNDYIIIRFRQPVGHAYPTGLLGAL